MVGSNRKKLKIYLWNPNSALASAESIYDS